MKMDQTGRIQLKKLRSQGPLREHRFDVLDSWSAQYLVELHDEQEDYQSEDGRMENDF